MPRIYLTSIDNDTASQIKNWANFDDSRLSGYNYGNLTDFEVKLWQGSISMPNKRYFAVKRIEDDRFIGFIGLKNINPLIKRAKLGIVFDPNFVSKGFGYEAVNEIMKIFFKDMKYKSLTLDVNSFNKRAIQLYKKCGFKEVSRTREVFENQDIEIDNRYFEYSNGLIYAKIINMKISKDDYNEL
ncbi:GNAT family N-acetyltransferase [uncultured Anaerococcus sp.]|uniref:GNAT family N-acetyltransferase n=1 Tax=uncultured Anaerococcus sp. TaxID=293428 RepID=UPI0025F3D425|nr:GNAT family protein [uncultured Anaerococcus sp.]